MEPITLCGFEKPKKWLKGIGHLLEKDFYNYAKQG